MVVLLVVLELNDTFVDDPLQVASQV